MEDGEPVSATLPSAGVLAVFMAAQLMTANDAFGDDAPNSERATQSTQAAVRLDCGLDFNRNRGANQPCIDVSGIRLWHEFAMHEKTKVVVRADPFGTTAQRFERQPFRRDVPTIAKYSKLILVDDYRLSWLPKPNLVLSIGKFQGTTQTLLLSGLPRSAEFSDSGWDQTAVTVAYHLPPLHGVDVLIAAGNGEGENAENFDPQQYMGLRIEAALLEGLKSYVGVSYDGNNVGSSEYSWHYDSKTTPSVGFSTQRMAAGVFLDGRLSDARGLKFGMVWQRAVLTDLDKDVDSVPNSGLAHGKNDPGEFIIEDPEHIDAMAIKRTVVDLQTSYRILDKYFIAASYEWRSIFVSDEVPFQACKSISSNVCDKDGTAVAEITQSAYSYGLGFDLAPGMTLVGDFTRTAFDKLYDTFNYEYRDGGVSAARETLNIRLSYNWN